MAYCPLCGNTGIDIDGNPCTCRFNATSFFESVSCLEVPEQYRGIQFSKALVPQDLHISYPEFLQSLYDRVLSGKWSNYNVVLCSPIGHSKTILAYSCMEVMFRNGMTVFPVYDVLELKRIITDMDLCRKQLYDIDHPENMFLTPLLFVKIPRQTSWDVYDTITLILDRRVRRGFSTVFIYEGSWSQLIYNDKNAVLSSLQGDGKYNTVDVKSWWLPSDKGQKEVKVVVEENIG